MFSCCSVPTRWVGLTFTDCMCRFRRSQNPAPEMIYRTQDRDAQGLDPVSVAQSMECSESICQATPWPCPLVACECTRYGYKRIENQIRHRWITCLAFLSFTVSAGSSWALPYRLRVSLTLICQGSGFPRLDCPRLPFALFGETIVCTILVGVDNHWCIRGVGCS